MIIHSFGITIGYGEEQMSCESPRTLFRVIWDSWSMSLTISAVMPWLRTNFAFCSLSIFGWVGQNLWVHTASFPPPPPIQTETFAKAAYSFLRAWQREKQGSASWNGSHKNEGEVIFLQALISCYNILSFSPHLQHGNHISLPCRDAVIIIES